MGPSLFAGPAAGQDVREPQKTRSRMLLQDLVERCVHQHLDMCVNADLYTYDIHVRMYLYWRSDLYRQCFGFVIFL